MCFNQVINAVNATALLWNCVICDFLAYALEVKAFLLLSSCYPLSLTIVWRIVCTLFVFFNACASSLYNTIPSTGIPRGTWTTRPSSSHDDKNDSKNEKKTFWLILYQVRDGMMSGHSRLLTIRWHNVSSWRVYFGGYFNRYPRNPHNRNNFDLKTYCT